MSSSNRIKRRKFILTTLVTAAGAAIAPAILSRCTERPQLMKRTFGKLGFEVTTFGLGGQASLQWTPYGIDPVAIILKAFDIGVNYFDTSNLYGPSQTNFGKAFRKLKLIPGETGYDETLRKSIFLTTKTHLRYAKGTGDVPGVNNWTNGSPGSHTIDDLRRSLSQMFGDGEGSYPEGSYVDMVLFHNLNTKQEVDAIFEGLENPDPAAERIGALAALRDYRDGTNLTGLNPRNEKLIRHIGFSGHFDPSVNMYMIQRDRTNLLDAMLVAINANDKLMFNMQYNVLPLAAEKKMGVIAMKVFADGAMYTKPAEWSNNRRHVVTSISSPNLPSRSLIQYSLTTPGVHLAIIGIGVISMISEKCQLSTNIQDSQILPGGLTEAEREKIEEMAAKAKEGKTNYFQLPFKPLTAPDFISISQKTDNSIRAVLLSWNTAYAGDAPLKSYEIWRDGNMISSMPFTPQITTDPLTFSEQLNDKALHSYFVRIVDAKNRTADSAPVVIEKI